MKERYWLFTGFDYENQGGLNDLDGTYKSVDEAKIYGDKKHMRLGGNS